jgi:acetylornithine deacetylase/succinyl-diaminopimelate desuccinylase-like protein
MSKAKADYHKLNQEELLPLLRSMIQAACVNDGRPESGDEIRNAKILQKYFNGKKLRWQTFEMLPGRTNLIVRVPGTDPQAPSLMLMGHTDVVPADPSTWQVDPFGGNVRDGQVWGRGALDMLNWTASEAVGFAKALEEHGPFPGDLIFLALADEEAAGRYGARFLVEERWEDVACDYMVTELGGFFWDGHDGPKASITLGEKGVCWLKIKSKGVPGHGSMPYKAKNAARDLAKAFLCFFEYKDPLKASDIFKSMVQGMGLGESNIRDLLQEETWEMALDELYLQDPGRAKFLDTAGRTTFSPNGIHVGSKINIIPESGELWVDIRFLPGEDKASLQAKIAKILGPLVANLEISFDDFHMPNLSPQDTPLYSAISEIFDEAHPDAKLVPSLIGGVTDGRYWRPKGTVVYGFNLFSKDLTMDKYGKRIHGIDERVSIDSLEKHLEFFAQLPQRFFEHWEKGK